MTTEVRTKLAGYLETSTSDFVVALLEGFVKYLPQDGSQNICEDILGCDSNEELRSLANHLLTAVLVPMKMYNRIPLASPSPRAGAKDSVDEIASELLEKSHRNNRVMVMAACLCRDNIRCVLSGFYNEERTDYLSPAELETVIAKATDVAYIFPASLGNLSETERWNTATIWDALYRCFPRIRSSANLSAHMVLETHNAMTMELALLIGFREFLISIKPTEYENVYGVKAYPQVPPRYAGYLPAYGTITLTAHTSDPLPNPSLLEAHASIAQILHKTGLGDYINDTIRKRRSTHNLASDGSTDIASLLLVL